MPTFTRSLSSVLFALSLFRIVSSACQSSGTDYVDLGGPYCINTTSTDYFSFGTQWTGCVASDAQGGEVTPILVDPSNNEYFCSDIAVTPEGVTMTSVCDVAGNVVRKSQMVSGEWIVVLDGLTFANMRRFSLIATPPVTITSTPTVTFSYTSTPKVTATTTTTVTITSTLPASTITVPSTTLTRTSTITPAPVTSNVNSIFTFTNVFYVFGVTTTTVTLPTSCINNLRFDAKATVTPSKASQLAKSTSKASSANKPRLAARLQKDQARAQAMRREASARGLLEARTLDVCTTTVLASTNLPSKTITITAPTSTVVVPTAITSTILSTPPPVTQQSGRASTTITITKPTQTITNTLRGFTTTQVISTILATITSTIFAKPTPCS